jgi:hypothetical protein
MHRYLSGYLLQAATGTAIPSTSSNLLDNVSDKFMMLDAGKPEAFQRWNTRMKID